jgi:hypothetical protein
MRLSRQLKIVLAAEREARAPVTYQERRRRSEVSEEEFERRQALVKHQSFWAWLQHTDNATHFKSKENLNFWSERPAEYAKWLKIVWVEFGCPGHGKGPWDGLGAMAKSKVTVDIMHGKERTSTGKITSAMLVAQHLRAIFCNKDWDMEHADMKIQQVVVMYLHDHQISHARASCHVFLLCFLVYRGTMRGGRSAVGARHARVCVAEDTDPSPVDRISWWKVVRAPSRPFGQKTNLLSQHQQGFGIVT